jgi:hypothetical protein
LDRKKRSRCAWLFVGKPSAQAKIEIARRCDGAQTRNYLLQLALFSRKRFARNAILEVVAYIESQRMAGSCLLDLMSYSSAVHFSHGIPQR